MLKTYRTLPIKIHHQTDGNKLKKENNEKLGVNIPDENDGRCIAMYIRRGDKGSEMRLQPFSKYAEAVDVVMTTYFQHKNHKTHFGHNNHLRHHSNNSEESGTDTRSKPAIFIGTEDSDVLKEAIQWGKTKGYQVNIIASSLLFHYFSLATRIRPFIRVL